MAGTTGLEPATSGVTGQRSNQLNYVPGLGLDKAGFRPGRMKWLPAEGVQHLKECSRPTDLMLSRFHRTTQAKRPRKQSGAAYRFDRVLA